MLNLSSLMINSDDYKKLGAYYGEVLQKKPEWDDDKMGMVGFKAGACFISFMPHDKVHGKSPNPERIILFFDTDDVKGEFDRIKAIEGTVVIAEPYHPGGDDKYSIATLADPDGNYFQLVTPWDEDKK